MFSSISFRQEQLLFKQQQQLASPNKDLNTTTASVHGGNINLNRSGHATENLTSSSSVHILDLTSSTRDRPVSSRGPPAGETMFVSAHRDTVVSSAEAQANVIQALTEIASARARAATLTSCILPDESVFSDSGIPMPSQTMSTFDELANTTGAADDNMTSSAPPAAVIPVMSQAEMEVIQKLKRFKEVELGVTFILVVVSRFIDCTFISIEYVCEACVARSNSRSEGDY